jgi:hypothetical protein
MNEMNEFFRKRDAISISRERGDRLRISNKDGSPANIGGIREGNCSIHTEAKDRAISFINILSDLTKWNFDLANWICWDNLKFYQFKKGDFVGDKKTITIQSFREFTTKNPLSWAMTSGTNIEYTLEKPSKFF